MMERLIYNSEDSARLAANMYRVIKTTGIDAPGADLYEPERASVRQVISSYRLIRDNPDCGLNFIFEGEGSALSLWWFRRTVSPIALKDDV